MTARLPLALQISSRHFAMRLQHPNSVDLWPSGATPFLIG
jgi:hypothetical protein